MRLSKLLLLSGALAGLLTLAACADAPCVEAPDAVAEAGATGDTGAVAEHAPDSGDGQAPAGASDAPADDSDTPGGDSDTATGDDGAPLVSRGDLFFGVEEQFNRYYTDPDWRPARTLYVSRTGGGDAASGDRDAPASVEAALDIARPGDQLVFLADAQPYEACYELTEGGTWEAPIALVADREGGAEVTLRCCETGRKSCINLEGADYVAVDGFVLEGGDYGVRAVGLGVTQSRHQRGVAVLRSRGRSQWKDPFFTGQSDWSVFEDNVAHGAREGDGHGIYISNGSDWGIVRHNQMYDNLGSDLQINADPFHGCAALDDEACWGSALDGLGAGVSEFFWVEGNYLHDGAAQGPNFTSVRGSVIHHNVFGPYARHGVSFWQETAIPELGSSHNQITDNLFVGTTAWSHVLQLIEHASHNRVEGNLLLGLSPGDPAGASEEVLLVEQDRTGEGNVFAGNFYVGGATEGPTPEDFSGHRAAQFSEVWFSSPPLSGAGDLSGWTPTDEAPFDAFGGWTPPVIPGEAP